MAERRRRDRVGEATEEHRGRRGQKWARMDGKQGPLTHSRAGQEKAGVGREARSGPYEPPRKASVALGKRPTLNKPPQAPQGGSKAGAETVVEAPQPLRKQRELHRKSGGKGPVKDKALIGESETGSESGPDLWDLGEEFMHLQVQADGEPSANASGPLTLSQEYPGIFQDQLLPRLHREMGSPDYEQDLVSVNHSASLTVPRLDQLSRRRGQVDRVARYLEYKRDWDSRRLPGEDQRKEVRWGVHEQMLYRDTLPKPQHRYVPNNYLIPTEKKRSALRWGIRRDLAQGIMPRKLPFPLP